MSHNTLEAWVRNRDGNRPIRRILVANNGLAATKAIRSMRHWARSTFPAQKTLHFIAMATAEDVEANAEYVRLADQFVQVASGSSANNYGNVELVVKTARRVRADAVWPGWGHASENPRLPAELERHGIAFIGPPSDAMEVVGDKIKANLLAQSCDINVIPWSGTGITVEGKHIPPTAISEATLKDEDEAAEVASRVGYPAVLKASEGGGGKGIRTVRNDAELKAGFSQVAAEVPGSPIFMQKLSADSRHLEVQVVADAWGNAISLFGRDCSVQRRHQKIIEEGPITIAPESIRRRLEEGAVRLAKRVPADEVGYRGAGTVEYLYNTSNEEYSFLEVNPRLQVEHPVTEMITDTNIPALQLQVAMGIPLYRMDHVRSFFNRAPGGTDPIDFDGEDSIPPKRHCIAGRLTAEDPEESFKPSSGSVNNLHFRQLPGVMGYFSVGNVASKVHQFADSQFGHIFTFADSRIEACRLMEQALNDVTVRGEVNTNVKYLQRLVSMEALQANRHNTTWLDTLIAKRDSVERPPLYLCVIAGAIVVAERRHREMEDQVLNALGRGVAPDMHSIRLSEHTFDLIYDGYKFHLQVQMGSRSQFHVWNNGNVVTADVLRLPDGVLLMLLAGQTHIVNEEPCKIGLRVHLDGFPCYFPEDSDPTKLVATSTGKLLRFLFADGGRVKEGDPFAEVEVMKTVMPLAATSSGKVSHCVSPGTAIEPGTVLCHVELDDPESCTKTELYKGNFPELSPTGTSLREELGSNAYERFKRSLECLRSILNGYHAIGDPFSEFLDAVRSSELVVADFEEQISCVSGRVSVEAVKELEAITHILSNCKEPMRSLGSTDDIDLAIERIRQFVDEHSGVDVPELQEFVLRYERGLFAFECEQLSQLLNTYLDVEEAFAGDNRFEDELLRLREEDPEGLNKLCALAHAHSKLETRNKLVLRVLDQVERNNMADHSGCFKSLQRLAVLQSSKHSAVSQRAREVIIKLQDESRQNSRKWRTLKKSNSWMDTRPSDHANGMDGDALPSPAANESSYVISSNVHSVGSGGVQLPPYSANGYGHGSQEDWSAESMSVTDGSSDISTFYDTTELTWSALFEGENLRTRREAAKLFSDAFGVEAMEMQTVSDGIFVRESNGVGELFCNSELSLDGILWRNRGFSINCSTLRLVLHASILLGMGEEGAHAWASRFVERRGQSMADDMGLREVSISFVGDGRSPHHFHFCCNGQLRTWQEDTTCRGVNPLLAEQWELRRLKNFSVKQVMYSEPKYPSTSETSKLQYKTDYRIGAFLAEESALYGKNTRDRRIFLRAAVYNIDILLMSAASDSMGPKPMRTVSGILQEMGEEMSGDYDYAGTDTERGDHDVPNEESVLADVLGNLELTVGRERTAWNHVFINVLPFASKAMDAYEEEDAYQSIAELLEAFLEHCLRDLQRLKVECIEVKLGGHRIIATNPTGYRFRVEHSTTDGSQPPPYPLLDRIQRKRMVAHSLNSTYVYDFESILSDIVSKRWQRLLDRGAVGSEWTHEAPWEAVELFLGEDDNLHRVDRPYGENTIGMVCWLCKIRTANYPEGREIVIIASDITFLSGSLSPAEDRLYVKATMMAIERGLPVVYISANSGARIGLDEEVKSRFKVAWVDDNDPAKGFRYMYLTDEDYQAVREKEHVLATRIQLENGDIRWRLDGLVGGMGVECLQGSGSIARVTSEAYRKTITLTYVTGRSVGIGAYCTRLSQRVVQHVGAPIILTGNSALNKLMGKEVYKSNNQIGGPKVMGHNGVSQQLASNDAAGMAKIVQWLDFTSPVFKMQPRRLPVEDTPEREPAFEPPEAEAYDPREMLEGFFDNGSVVECMAEWGKTIVACRASLDGIPMGAIAVETRLVERTVPADPASQAPQQHVEQQAGNVWFPDSAHKTAQALRDFNLEGLPLIVFANWRGFAGGLRDMFGEVLKFGAKIVDALRTYEQPIFVYVPHEGELRGGAWVVIDTSINPEQMEFYAASQTRGNVLEPEGITDIKFRKQDLQAAMRRTCPNLFEGMSQEDAKRREEEAMPAFRQLAVQFAALHDLPEVMEHKGAIRGVIPWQQSRSFFASRLRRRLTEEAFKARARESNPRLRSEDLKAILRELDEEVEKAAPSLAGSTPAFEDRLRQLRRDYIRQSALELFREDPSVVMDAICSEQEVVE